MKIVHRVSCLAILLASIAVSNAVFAQGGGGGATGGTTGATGGLGTTTGTGTTAGTGTTNRGTSTSSSSQSSTSGTGTTSSLLGGTTRQFADVGAAGTTGGTTARGGTGGISAGGRGGLSTQGLNQLGTTSSSSQSKPTVRTRMRSEVTVAPRSEAVTRGIVQQRAGQSYSQPRFDGVATSFNGPTTVIGGTVANEKDRRMAELIMRLEPGVSRIENRIIVSP